MPAGHFARADHSDTASRTQAAPPPPPRRKLNVWSAYRLGMRLKANLRGSLRARAMATLKLMSSPALLSRLLSPIDYVRYREFDFALRAVARHAPAPRTILDISSPKLVPLTLAAHLPSAEVHATDVLEREVTWVGGAAGRLELTNVTAEVQDARRVGYADERFDLVTSISVFEHIAPEIDGEIPAIREVARVLEPGGVAVLTVPFARKYFADYVTGSAYEREGKPGEPIFFQRFYDEALLMRNLVIASGLELVELSFVEERYFLKDPRKRMAHFVNGSPRQTFWFGPLYPLIAKIFLSRPKPLHACAKPYLACIVLKKPAVR